jgi:hypothetical protein
VLSSANGVENLTSNGVLLGGHFGEGPDYRGIAGIYATYEYLSPEIYHLSTTSVSIGTTGQWWIAQDWAVQGSVLGGVDYVRSHRSAEFAGGADRRQTMGQVGVFYTLLGQQDFGAVEWRDAGDD